jgi:regulator of RNase E activity RraA
LKAPVRESACCTRGILAGAALTVKTRPGDNLMIHKAADIALPGDVIVVDGGGDLTNALIGELILRYAQSKGVVGFVVNGARAISISSSQAIILSMLPE